jgi:hypothetical protein
MDFDLLVSKKSTTVNRNACVGEQRFWANCVHDVYGCLLDKVACVGNSNRWESGIRQDIQTNCKSKKV